MKKLCTMLITILALLLNISIAFAQVPQSFNYQAVVRNGQGEIIPNTSVSFRISLIQGGATVHTETFNKTTNQFGLVNLKIGSGNENVDWSAGTVSLKVEFDPDGGTNYIVTGNSELLSVPYALYSEYSNSVGSGSNVGVYSSIEIAEITPRKGDAVFNSTDKTYQIWDGTSWMSFAAECWPQPTTADAGTNQTFNDGTISATLTANTPEAYHGTGVWSIISGIGGSFTDSNNPTTTFIGQFNEKYILQWSITTSCSHSNDYVTIIFAQDGTGGTLIDIDGNNYNTVWIGGQLWMAENLKVTKETNGIAIPLADSTIFMWETINISDKAYAYYNYDISYKNTFGALYTFAAAKNACPSGWHLPTDEEWKQLEMYLGMSKTDADSTGFRLSGNVGFKLKSTMGWSGNGDNSSGFNAMPSGYCQPNNGRFYWLNSAALYWSSTLYGLSNAWYRYLNTNTDAVNRHDNRRSSGYSVRCVRD